MKNPMRNRRHKNCTEDCQECGAENIVWFVASPIWNRVMRDDSKPHSKLGIVCPTCFVRHAEAIGIVPSSWELVPEFLQPLPIYVRPERFHGQPIPPKVRAYAEAEGVAIVESPKKGKRWGSVKP